MWECEWGNLVKENSEIKEHVYSYSLSSRLTPREALYGGRCETFSLHASCTDTSVIKYVDVQSLYPYVCKNKHYPIGHPRCLIGPDLRKFGMDVNKFEGLVKCKVLPPRGLHIPLLPSHINKKLMFVLCRKCAETENQSICNHSVGDRSLSGTWVSVELQKAVQIGYTLLKVYEVWQYDTITKYDPSTGDGGLFAQYMNTFMKIKWKHLGTLLSVIRTKKKTSTLNVYESTKELHCVQMTFHSMQDVVQLLNFASIISGENLP